MPSHFEHCLTLQFSTDYSLFVWYRTRRLLRRQNREVQGAAKVMSMLQSSVKVEKEDKMELDNGSSVTHTTTQQKKTHTYTHTVEDESLILDVTAEFCRQVGEEEDDTTGMKETTYYLPALTLTPFTHHTSTHSQSTIADTLTMTKTTI